MPVPALSDPELTEMSHPAAERLLLLTVTVNECVLLVASEVPSADEIVTEVPPPDELQ